jgi:hypothetical protein
MGVGVGLEAFYETLRTGYVLVENEDEFLTCQV